MQKSIEIKADSLEEALKKVENQYKNEQIVLDSMDLIDTKILPI